VEEAGDRKVLIQPEAPDCGILEARSWTMNEYYAERCQLAKALIAAGVEPHTGVTIQGFNSPEWLFANNAAVLAGALSAGVYPTQTVPMTQYQLKHCRASVAFVDDRKQLSKLLEMRDSLPQLKYIVIWREGLLPSDNVEGKAKVLTYEEFVQTGSQVSDAQLDQRMVAQTPENAMSLIYTSGTTGMPKAVMLSHDNVTWTTGAMVSHKGLSGLFMNHHETHRIVSYLPLSHIAGAMLDIYMPIWFNAFFKHGSCITFARPDALKGTLKGTLCETHPTIFFAVPRVWEKFEEAIRQIGAQNTGLKKRIGDLSKDALKKTNCSRQTGEKPQKPGLMDVVGRKVMGKVHAALGLDKCVYCGTGAAPISPMTLEYFASLNIVISELYGMSECTGPHTTCTPELFKFGTCGSMLPGCYSLVDHVPGRDKEGEGELKYKGRHVMMGYMYDEANTRKTIDPEQWLATGDVVSLKSYATGAPELLKITGRVKELIITAGGENIAPVPIETKVKEYCPGLGNLMMIGDKQKFCSIIVAAKVKEDAATGSATEELVAEALLVDPACKTVADARQSALWKKHIQDGIDKYNKEDAVSQAQKLQKWAWIPTTFTVAGGELGPTLKLKRGPTADKYQSVIDSMYAESA
jgi:long-chain-fatty-acid--CoA ligase ACSBG